MAKTKFIYGVGNVVKTKKFDGKTIGTAINSTRLQGELGLDPNSVTSFVNGCTVPLTYIISPSDVISFSKIAHEKGSSLLL